MGNQKIRRKLVHEIEEAYGYAINMKIGEMHIPISFLYLLTEQRVRRGISEDDHCTYDSKKIITGKPKGQEKKSKKIRWWSKISDWKLDEYVSGIFILFWAFMLSVKIFKYIPGF